MPSRKGPTYKLTKRAIGGLVGFLSLAGSAAMLAYVLSKPDNLLAWLLLAALIALAGVGAHLARRR
jgi:hypothetical protein